RDCPRQCLERHPSSLARENHADSLRLFVAGLRVDEYRDFPVPLMDSLRVVDSHHVADPIERNIAVLPFLDLSSDQCFAAAVTRGGETGELAAAGGAAVTGLNVVNRDPVRHGRHRSISPGEGWDSG